MTPPSPAPPPIPPPPSTAGNKVRCASCKMVLSVPPNLINFSCPYPNCLAVQMLPPSLLPENAVIGIDSSKIQVSCAQCKATLNVPRGFERINCPQCMHTVVVDSERFPSRPVFRPTPPAHVLPPNPVYRPAGFPMPPIGVRFPAGRGGPPVVVEPAEEVNEMAKEVEQEEDEGGLAGETFTDYRPSKLSIGPSHPDPIVETSSLSAVQPPEPTYTLRIQDNLENSKALSCLQIETLVYACQRHLQHLPNGERAGFFLGDGAGVGKGRTVAGLIWENWQYGRKRALWISIGPDLVHDARRDLEDVGAKGIKVEALNKLPYTKIAKKDGFMEGVIFLTYSSLIASSDRGQSRLKQLVTWCGEFQGLIIFDECHKAKNLVPESGSQPTKTGEAVLEIQAKLPQARVVYCSATGASEPRNMGYMVRLGLWGDGTSFPDFRDFLGAMEKGGVGALELVAMDMKARGMYVCRTLSYKGAEFEVVEVPLEANMMDMYIKAAKFWLDLRKELILAIHHLDESSGSVKRPNSNQLWRFYWASHQRFFRYMCMAAKVPAVVRLSKQALLDDKCVVIGLQTTGEARTEEAVTKYGVELDDFISGPRELLLKLVEDNYPLPEKPEPDESIGLPRKRHRASTDVSVAGGVQKAAKHEEESGDESEWQSESDTEAESESDDDYDDDDFQICSICNSEGVRKKLLLCSGCPRYFHSECLASPVEEAVLNNWLCPTCKLKSEEDLRRNQSYYDYSLNRYEQALARKSSIIEIIRSLDLPNNALDDIIDQLGGPDKVAEMTGRRGMLVRASEGKGVTYQARNTKDVSMDMVNMHEKKLFMDGKKLVAIISEAGSAGVSLQADRRAANQKRRVHLTLELPWSADRAIQQFGRTHRSNQTSAPEYRLLFTNLGGERRFASVVAKRLESLGALTQGDRRAGPSLSAYNYDSTYGKKALEHMYKGLTGLDELFVPPPSVSAGDFIMMGNSALVSVGIIKDLYQDDGKDNMKDLRKPSGRVADSDMRDVGRFLNRLLGLAPDIQNSLFEYFVLNLDKVTADARRDGHLDSGIVNMRASSIEQQGKPKTVHVDDMSGASTMLYTFTLDRGMSCESASTLLEEKQKEEPGSSHNGFYESRREWMGTTHFILALENVASGMYKIYRPNLGESFREMSLAEVKGKYRKISDSERGCRGWKNEYESSSKHCMHGPKCKLANFCYVGRRMQEVNVLGGLILPVWGVIEKVLSKQIRQSYKRIRVVRIETTSDSQRVVGLLIPNSAVDSVLQDLAWVQEL